MLPDLYCHGCDADTSHTPVSAGEAACTGCGTVREVDADTVMAVIDVAYCDRCRATLPTGHECSTDPTPCLRKTGLWPCGTCETCIAAMRADPRYGSPSDLDGGA